MNSGILSFFEEHHEKISQIFNIGCDINGVFRLNNITDDLCHIVDALAVVVLGATNVLPGKKELVSVSINPGIVTDEKERQKLMECFKTKCSLSHTLLQIGHITDEAPSTWVIQQVVSVDLPPNDNTTASIVAFFIHNNNNRNAIENLIRMVGTKIEYAIERDFNVENLSRQNQQLEEMHHQLTRKNLQLNTTIQELLQSKMTADENNQLKSAFLANLSHEIRTPMNVILGFSELVKSSSCTEQERQNYLEIIHQNGLQLLRIMDNLIDISKLKTRHILNTPKAISINQIIDRQNEYYSKMIEVAKKPILLKVVKGASEPNDTIYSNDEIISKVLGHLLDNAVKFTREGEVCFGYQTQGEKILFYVKDTGIGIPSGKEDVIFDLFRQADTKTTREFGGNGLGLALARNYLAVLGGEIWVEVGSPKGSTFYFTIPLKPSESGQQQPNIGIRDTETFTNLIVG